ncbi:Hint domain-containing protein [Phaeovulum vinaykumarii]|uniref:Hint domain-containing protein n=1 Tax=Phaeovulum vinaykumarii TaxID=407234 RepID=A0A1N7M3V9_9RHOB|nr:Hint domain-containing protein [Phaeovulum vinaykumarii]SIS80723.1 Hint domain-containing protein [Phaeovulum vinaykumarii]SOC09003.1 Hint domain-containing protein [Phaeovulum vinaykumarii]
MTVADLTLGAAGANVLADLSELFSLGAEGRLASRFAFSDHDERNGLIGVADAEGQQRAELSFTLAAQAVPCLSPQAMVASDRGLVRASALRPGMRIVTRDNGLQELAWIGYRRFDWRALGLAPQLLGPVLIRKGALGADLPEADVLVSPNHRFLTTDVAAGTLQSGRLIAAADLVGRPGIERASVAQVTYVQLLLARHELVMADGIWSESFQADALRLAALDPEVQADLRARFPDLVAPERADVAVRPDLGPAIG